MLWFRVRETQRVSVQFRTSSLSLQWSLSHIHVLHHSKNTESQKLDPDHRRSLQRSHQSLLRHPVVRRSPAGRSLGVLADTPRSPQAVSFSRPVERARHQSCDPSRCQTMSTLLIHTSSFTSVTDAPPSRPSDFSSSATFRSKVSND